MSGTETPYSSPITSASLRQANSLLKGDVGQEVIAMMNTSGLYLENNMLHDKTGVIADLGKDSIYYPGNKAIFLKVDTIDSKEHLVIGGEDDEGFRYCTVVDSLGFRDKGERKSASREELEKLGFSLPNSSVIAVESTPKKLQDLFGDVSAVPSVEDLEQKIQEVKALGAKPVVVSDDPLTELKTANKELADMLEEFLEVEGNKIYAVHIGYDLEQEIVGIHISLEGGLSFEGRNSTSGLAKWQKIRFDDTGSQRLASKYK